MPEVRGRRSFLGVLKINWSEDVLASPEEKENGVFLTVPLWGRFKRNEKSPFWGGPIPFFGADPRPRFTQIFRCLWSQAVHSVEGRVKSLRILLEPPLEILVHEVSLKRSTSNPNGVASSPQTTVEDKKLTPLRTRFIRLRPHNFMTA